MSGPTRFLILGLLVLYATKTIKGTDICPEENPPINIVLPHQSDCTKFYRCIKGKKVEQKCAEGLYFNSLEDLCVIPDNVNCVTDNTNRYQLKIYPHHTECSKFYLLVKGKLTKHSCPTGLHFNSKLKICDYKVNAKCHKL